MKEAKAVDQFELHCLEESAGLALIDSCDSAEAAQYQQLLASHSPLPPGVYSFRTDAPAAHTVFYRYRSGLSPEEKREFVALKQLETQRKIHFWVRFWSIVGIVTFGAGILAGLIVLLGSL